MNETYQEIQEVKHLKNKQLVRFNLIMLLLFVLFGYLATNEKHSLLFGIICFIFLIILAVTWYTLITGRSIGTKTSRRVQEFDRKRLGEKRWKRRKLIETVLISVTAVFIIKVMFDIDFNTISFDFPLDAFPFIGVWIGYNIGEVIRMNKL